MPPLPSHTSTLNPHTLTPSRQVRTLGTTTLAEGGAWAPSLLFALHAPPLSTPSFPPPPEVCTQGTTALKKGTFREPCPAANLLFSLPLYRLPSLRSSSLQVRTLGTTTLAEGGAWAFQTGLNAAEVRVQLTGVRSRAGSSVASFDLHREV